MTKNVSRLFYAGSLILSLAATPLSQAAEPYTADWDSLRKHPPVPEWLRDAKLGFYATWGVYCVPAFGNEWYPSYMFAKEGKNNKLGVYAHHQKTYGDPSKFGYHDFVPMFTAEKFNADEWADLYQKSGAKFGGTVTEHHDGFSLWASKVNPWNAKDMGPQRDIIGELEKAIRARGMKFIVTMHHARMYGMREGRVYWTKAPGWPTSSDDPKLRILYGNMPKEEGIKLWRSKLDEVLDAYRPDMTWFDIDLELVPDQDKREFIASYFNKAQGWGKEVLVTYKLTQLPPGIGLLDYENGRASKLMAEPWLTDDTIGVVKSVWSYVPDMKIKSTQALVHELIDIVSKNGQLLLNMSPRADGSIPDDQRASMLGLGRWLAKYGEAIYYTRPWLIYGEGKKSAAGFPANDNEIRYTAHANKIYASLLNGKLNGERLVLHAFAEGGAGAACKITDVKLMGSDAKIAWTRTPDGLEITLPSPLPDPDANVLVLTK
ncbi:MAG TPA: alpha-L-fucosidase [Pontiellaceae bacterium]|mgnify:CR=1 FL=1|nr:alpha-L-fucosidase [Pontiellaceae bacterium]